MSEAYQQVLASLTPLHLESPTRRRDSQLKAEKEISDLRTTGKAERPARRVREWFGQVLCGQWRTRQGAGNMDVR